MSASIKPSVITYLPLLARKQQQTPSSEPHSALSSAAPRSTLAARLAQFRAQRVDRFFCKRAAQRELAAQLSPAARIAHKLSQLVALFARSNRAALQAKLRAFFSRDTVARGVRGMLSAIRNTIKRLRRPNAAELLACQLQQQQRMAQRRAFLQRLFSTLAHQGRNLLRLKRKSMRREHIHVFAPVVVHEQLLSPAQLQRIAGIIVAQRDAAEQRRQALVIQCAWRQLRRTQLARSESKTRLLSLLATMTPVLQRQDKRIQQRQDALQQTCMQTHAQILLGASRRLAARLIQRVWRGYRARMRVFQLCAWRRKRAQQQLQKARLQKAREALLQPSAREQELLRATALRAQSRMHKTPLPLLLSRGRDRARPTLTHARASLLQPLPMQTPPPRISALTRAKTQCVPFTTFEKICAQRARVNAQNLWVAIPVCFDDTSEQSAAAAGAKRRSGKRNRFFAAQYDWLPATLLQQQEQE